MSKRNAEKRKERERRLKKEKLEREKERVRRASQPPTPDPDWREPVWVGNGYVSSFGPIGDDETGHWEYPEDDDEDEELFAGLVIP